MNINDDDDNQDQEESGSSSGGTRTATQPPIDQEAIIESVMQRLQGAGRQSQQQQQHDRDEVADLVYSLAKQGYSKDYIEAQTQTATTLEKALEKKVNTAQTAFLVRQRDQQAASFINAQLRGVYKETPSLKELDASIRNEIKNEFNKNPGNVREWNNLFVNEDTIDECITKAVEKYSKFVSAEDGKPSAPKGSLTGKVGAKVAPSVKKGDDEDEEEAERATKLGILDIDDLTDNQRAAYHAAKMNNIRYFGMDKEKAAKEALKHAKSMPSPMLKKRNVYAG